MKVTHVITSLSTGGAQTALYRLVAASRETGIEHRVVSLTDEGAFGDRFAEIGVPMTCLRMRPGVPDPMALARLVRVFRRERPDLVQAWMYHANLMAGLAAALVRVPVVWNIRHADVDPGHAKPLTRLTNSLCARLSGVLPTRIVCCAEAARRSHRGIGYREERMVVIPNGFDADRFVNSAGAKDRVRAELSIDPAAKVVGLLARFHPDKDHDTLLGAARLVIEREPRAVFILAGEQVEWSNPALAGAIDRSGLRPFVRLLGVRRDVPALLSAMDVLASSSRSEAFPQVLGEAMACEVPCAATDCGDSREILGRTGRIVPTADPPALAGAILELLALSREERASLGRAARQRVRERYDLVAMARRYQALYVEILGARGVAGHAIA